MKVDDMLLQMAYAASQAASATLPVRDQASGQESGTSDFKTLLEDKRTEAGKAEQPNQAGTEQVENGQIPSAEMPVNQTMEAVLYSGVQMNLPVMVQQMDPAAVSGQETQQQMVITPTAMPQSTETVVMPEETTQVVNPEEAGAVMLPQSENPEGEQTLPTVEAEGEEMPQAIQQTTNQVETGTQTEQDGEALAENRGGAKSSELEPGTEQTQVTSTAGQPLFQNTEVMPQRVGDAPALDTESADFEAKLTGELETALESGSQRVELKLTPEHLGNVVVEMDRSPDGVLHVVIHAENEQAAKILSEHTSTLSMLLQNGQQSEVRVEVQNARQNDQPWQQPDQGNGQQQSEQQRQQEQRRQNQQSELFLQQLRLGLLAVESQ